MNWRLIDVKQNRIIQTEQRKISAFLKLLPVKFYHNIIP